MSRSRDQKKPISKSTKALLQQLQRRHGVRELAKRFLIVCEDNKSSPHYFEALKKHLNLSAASIRVAGGGGRTEPLQVVELAVELKTNASEAESGTEPFAHVWCVIDGDNGAKITNARSKANANNIKIAITNKCFEYWILLHFEENDTPTQSCAQTVRALRHRHIKKYNKGKCEFQDIVKEFRLACERAKRLRGPGIKRGELPESQNPCSEIYLLIEEILEGE